ncbi:MAG: hypothetical protein AAF518_23295 [Spirochaetota bacterium]
MKQINKRNTIALLILIVVMSFFGNNHQPSIFGAVRLNYKPAPGFFW